MEGSDVTFDVAGEKIPGHKLVLVARSPDFGMDMSDKQEIVVTDLEPKVFKVKTKYF
jgi:speckle-type POZ protein